MSRTAIPSPGRTTPSNRRPTGPPFEPPHHQGQGQADDPALVGGARTGAPDFRLGLGGLDYVGRVVDLDVVALRRGEDPPRRRVLGDLALEVGLVEARDRVPHMILVVDRQMPLALSIDVGERAVAQAVSTSVVSSAMDATSARSRWWHIRRRNRPGRTTAWVTGVLRTQPATRPPATRQALAPHRRTSASMSRGMIAPCSSCSPHASRGTRHMISNSLPSGSEP